MAEATQTGTPPTAFDISTTPSKVISAANGIVMPVSAATVSRTQPEAAVLERRC